MGKSNFVSRPFSSYKSGMVKGPKVPAVIAARTDLTSTTKLIYGQLIDYDGPNGAIYPSQETLAERLGMSVRSIEEGIRTLKDKGLIRILAPTGVDRLLHRHNNYQLMTWEGFDDPDNVPPDPKPGSSTDPKQGVVAGKKQGVGATKPTSIKPTSIKPTSIKHTLSDLPSTSGSDDESEGISFDSGPKACFVANHSIAPASPKTASASKKKISDRYIALSQQLAGSIRSVRKMNFTPAQIQSWAVQFLCLHESMDGDPAVNFKRIRVILDWYCAHYPTDARADKWFPVAESGAAFREKFLRIEAAKVRYERGSSDGDSEGGYEPMPTHKPVKFDIRPGPITKAEMEAIGLFPWGFVGADTAV